MYLVQLSSYIMLVQDDKLMGSIHSGDKFKKRKQTETWYLTRYCFLSSYWLLCIFSSNAIRKLLQLALFVTLNTSLNNVIYFRHLNDVLKVTILEKRVEKFGLKHSYYCNKDTCPVKIPRGFNTRRSKTTNLWKIKQEQNK